MEAVLGTAMAPRRQIVPSALLGMLIFVSAELMFFAGMMSAFTISRANAVGGVWPPYGAPRLPVDAALFNTVTLLASGVLLVVANRAHARQPAQARPWVLGAWLFGLAFVALQAREWRALVDQGMTVTSSALGSFFYLLVGGHAVQAMAALLLLGAATLALWRRGPAPGLFVAAQVFWFFVVGLWPVIFFRLYF